MKVVLALADKNGNDFDEVSDGYTGYSGLEKALRDMNSQGVFAKGSVEVSAILEDDVATSIVINDKNAPSTGVSNPDVDVDEFLPASWNGTEIELRYYKTPMSDNEIKDAIANLLDEPVARLNKWMGYVELENGDMYRVDFDQIEVFALFVDGEIVDYADNDTDTSGSKLNVPNAGAAKYILDGLAGDTLYKGTGISSNKDRYLYTAYEVSGLTTNITGELNDGTDVTSTDKYVAEGETITITFSAAAADGYNILVDGDIVAEVAADSAKREVEVKVTGDVTITKKVSTTDLATLLEDTTTTVINLEPGKTYTLSQGVEIEANKTIYGNGATIETSSTLNGGWAFTINANNITLTINDVNFVNNSGVTAIKDYAVTGYTVNLYGCSFTGYNTSVQLFNVAGGEISDCEFNSTLVDISISGATGEVVIEDNTYTENPSLENIGLGGSNAAMNNVTINDDGIIVNRYPS